MTLTEPDTKAYVLASRLMASWMAAKVTKVSRVPVIGDFDPQCNLTGMVRSYSGFAQTSNRIREGSSTHSLIRTRKVTASRPSTMRWS